MGSIKLTPEQVEARIANGRRRLSRPIAEVEREILAERQQHARDVARVLSSSSAYTKA